MLDATIDLRTPRFLVIVRNAFGGAYASFNSYETGADFVVALPTTRLAVMGPAGVEFVYKKELREIRGQAGSRTQAWVKEQELALTQRYEAEIMNPKEALSLGSVSQIAMPSELRQVLGKQLQFYLSTYRPSPLQSVQREFH